MRVDVLASPEQTCLKLSGELDSRAVQEFEARLEALLSEITSSVVVDLTDLGYLDSTGIRALLRLDKHLKARALSLTLKGTTPPLFRIFRYCGLDTYFRFVAPDLAVLQGASPVTVLD